MEKHSSILSHSISRLLGHTDNVHLHRTERSSHVTSDFGTKEKRKSCQDDSPQTCTERARSPREVEHELSIYPWMEIHRSNQGKKMKSKRNLDCIPLLVLDIE